MTALKDRRLQRNQPTGSVVLFVTLLLSSLHEPVERGDVIGVDAGEMVPDGSDLVRIGAKQLHDVGFVTRPSRRELQLDERRQSDVPKPVSGRAERGGV